MILTIDDILYHSEKMVRTKLGWTVGRKVAADYIVVNRGVDLARLDTLKDELPGIPDSFLRVVSQIFARAIGLTGVELCPGRKSRDEYVDCILSWNQICDDLYGFYVEKYLIYIVGGIGEEPLCVARTDSPLGDGVVVTFQHDEPDRPPVYVAQNTWQLLLLACNAEEIEFKYRGARDKSKANEDFEEVMLALGANDAERKFWRRRALLI